MRHSKGLGRALLPLPGPEGKRGHEMPDAGTPQVSTDPPDDAAPLAEHVARNVRAIKEMHLQAERGINAHQRAVERATALLGRPASLYAILAFVLAWMIGAGISPHVGLGAWDPAPWFLLQGIVGLAALLVATMVLITQNRQAKASELHMHLDLQVNLLTEQRTAKLIQLLEELRRDLPNVRNRKDAEVDELQHPAPTLKVIAALEEHALEAVREAVADERHAVRVALRDAATDAKLTPAGAHDQGVEQ